MTVRFYDEFLKDTGDMIFVFGSNWRGVHGASAAKTAREHYGAVYGVPMGRQGHSYAIPTKDIHIQTLPLEQIELNVDAFKDYVRLNPQLTFYVTPIGTGLAGYKHSNIAPMFKGSYYGIERCMFYRAWEPFLA